MSWCAAGEEIMAGMRAIWYEMKFHIASCELSGGKGINALLKERRL